MASSSIPSPPLPPPPSVSTRQQSKMERENETVTVATPANQPSGSRLTPNKQRPPPNHSHSNGPTPMEMTGYWQRMVVDGALCLAANGRDRGRETVCGSRGLEEPIEGVLRLNQISKWR
ncbi:hypothetical protein LWI29_012882 [Acer saccharum]|uniref:Uncharacterized protein n=1 Tax=Acer saccharum TaxID=4024 RepID=A0AA39RWB8_ACESA|nr:hypothetical protein LWI29_012882 [Acer saccharum]